MENKKIFKVSTTTTREFEKNENVHDGFIEREIAYKIIRDMPIEYLRKLISFEKISYTDKISPLNPDWKNEKLFRLKQTLTSEWTATIEV